IAVTGINIWLGRRRTRDYLNDVWAGTIWSPPAALALTAITEVLLDIPSTALFWLAIAIAIAWACRVRDPGLAPRHLAAATAVMLVVLVRGYVAPCGTTVTPAAWQVTGLLMATALTMGAIASGPRRTAECVTAGGAPSATPHAEAAPGAPMLADLTAPPREAPGRAHGRSTAP